MSGREHRRRPPLRTDQRSQTLIDYVAGVSVFFITIAAILALMPSFVSPYQSDVAGEDTAQAERIAQQLVANLSDAGQPNHLDVSKMESVLALSQPDIATRFGVPEYTRINVTVSQLNGTTYARSSGTKLTSTITYEGQSAASGVRIVQFEGSQTTCDPACRLLVRVW